MVKCPVCGKKFTKTVWNKRFCSDRCKINPIVWELLRRQKEQRTMSSYYKAHYPEELAVKILNSEDFKTKWKKDFKRDDTTEDWDLINSEGIKIEVKSTINKYRYNGNYIRFNTPEQHKQIVMKFLLSDKGEVIDFDIIKKVNNKRPFKWKSLINRKISNFS